MPQRNHFPLGGSDHALTYPFLHTPKTKPKEYQYGQLDTEELEIRVLREKLQHMSAMPISWRGRKACQKRVTIADSSTLSCR